MVKKKPQEPHHEEHADETWLIPYSDLLTLLLALFIVLFASSSIDKDKAAQIQYALAAAFNSVPSNQQNGNVLQFMSDVEDINLEGLVNVASDSKGAKLEISTINMFKNGSAELKEEVLPVLKRIAELLNANKYRRFRLIVEGHTDDTLEANVNDYPSNWELSSARAGAVVRTLVEDGLLESRFQAVGMAGIAPIYPNRDAYGEPVPMNRDRNRRVNIRIEF